MGTALPGNVTTLSFQDKTIHLIGTAHVSQRSVEEVRELIQRVRPDTVCVELDRSRYEALTDPRRFRNLDLYEIIRGDKIQFTLASFVLTSYQRRMGARLGVTPGAELLAGVRAAVDVGATLVLADRDVQVTLKRSWARLGLTDRLQLLVAMVLSLFARSSEVSEEQIEALKDKETIAGMMGELAKHMPSLQVPLIDERDRYLMSMIQEAEGPVIVGVVGAGHVGGMARYVGKPIDRTELCQLPAASRWTTLKLWVIPSVFLGMLSAAWLGQAPSVAYEMLWIWTLFVGAATALATVLSGGTVATAAAGALVAPLARLLPLVKVDTLTAKLEATLRWPTENDREQIYDALLSLKEMRSNPFIRVLFVAVAARSASAAAAWAATAWALWLLFA